MIDYRKILIWYIGHVLKMEGVHFLSEGYIPFQFTEEEYKALLECRDIAEKD